MAKTRRDPSDYEPEANRFEDWLMIAEGKTIADIVDIDELIDKIENWLLSIDVYGSQQGNFAKSLLTYLLARNMIPRKSSKEIDIIKGFKVDRTGSKWINYEERALKRMYKNPKVTTGYIARELGRTKSSLYSKARRLGIKRPKNALTERDVQKKFAALGK